MLIAEIDIKPKKTVADPQGNTVKHGLESLGFKGIGHVHVGKFVTVELEINDKDKASAQITEMCKKLLANPVIEDFSFVIKEK